MKNLFLDDIREPSGVTKAWHKGEWGDFPSLLSWEIVRSYNDFVVYITANSLPERIAFDHDLSMEHYPMGETIVKPIDYSKYKEKTGYDCALFVINFCKVNGLEFPDYYVHSFNPIGRMNIINLIESYKLGMV